MHTLDDDGFDFPPTRHPRREAATGLFAILLVLAVFIGGGILAGKYGVDFSESYAARMAQQ